MTQSPSSHNPPALYNMSTQDDKLTEDQVSIITEHLDRLLLPVCANIDKLQSLATGRHDPYVSGQLTYWRHVKAGLEWAKRIAQQRKKK